VATRIVIGYNVENFAHAGDGIWEIRYVKEGDTPGSDSVRALIWANPASKSALFICGMGASENPEHAGSKDIVKSWYEKNVGKMSPDLTLQTSDFVLDFDVADFAAIGTHICEVCIFSKSGLRGIVWVNLKKNTLRPMMGSWQKIPATEKPNSDATMPPKAKP
jgi:hypothetical protein